MVEITEGKFEKLYRAAIESLRKLQEQNEELRRRNELLEAEGRRWAMEKIQQQAVIQRAIDHANATSNAYLEENSRLKGELRRRGNGDLD